MPKILKIDVDTVMVPLAEPVSFSTRTIAGRFYTVVKIECEGGGVGLGFCHAGSRSGSLTTAAVREFVAPLVIGESSFDVERHWNSVYMDSLHNGQSGAVMRALSAVDIALWDHNARFAGLPLWQYLGAARSDCVPAYASGGYDREGDAVEDLVDEVQGYVDAGFNAVKIKVGRASPAKDEKRVGAVRTAIGADRILMLDANNAWSDVPSALSALERLEPFRPYWIEEPFAPVDFANHAALRERIRIPLATGELLAGRWAYEGLIDQGAADIIQPDGGVCGGVTELRRIGAIASSRGVPVAPHGLHDLHVHMVAAIPNATFVEYFTDDRVLPFRRLITNQLEVSDGCLVLPSTPGLGFDFDERALAQYRVH